MGPNLVLSHITHQYLTVKDADASTIAAMTGSFNHDVQRLGLVNGAITVSITPLLNIQSVGSPVVYNLALKQTSSGAISYVLDPAIQFGDQVKYILNTVYPTWTKRDTIVKTYGSLPVQISDDASTSTNWSGTWATTSAQFFSPSNSFTESPGGNYANNADDTYELIQTVDLTNVTAAQASFYAKWDIEADYDYCQFQVSTDGGASWIGQCGNYTVSGSSTSWNGSVQPNGEPVYEGTQASWVLEEISLSDYIGQNIKVRFRFQSDGGVNQDGFYFDDFKIAYQIDNSGLEEQLISVKTFPNPANDAVVIATSETINNGLVRIFDQAGKVVFEQRMETQANQLTLNVANLPQGLYNVQVLNDDFVSAPVKLVIIH